MNISLLSLDESTDTVDDHAFTTSLVSFYSFQVDQREDPMDYTVDPLGIHIARRDSCGFTAVLRGERTCESLCDVIDGSVVQTRRTSGHEYS